MIRFHSLASQIIKIVLISLIISSPAFAQSDIPQSTFYATGQLRIGYDYIRQVSIERTVYMAISHDTRAIGRGRFASNLQTNFDHPITAFDYSIVSEFGEILSAGSFEPDSSTIIVQSEGNGIYDALFSLVYDTDFRATLRINDYYETTEPTTEDFAHGTNYYHPYPMAAVQQFAQGTFTGTGDIRLEFINQQRGIRDIVSTDLATGHSASTILNALVGFETSHILIADLDHQLAQSHDENAQLTQDLQFADSQVSDLNQQLVLAITDLENSQSVLAAAQAELSNAQIQLEQTFAKNVQLTQDLQLAYSQVSALNQQLVQANTVLENSQNELAVVQSELTNTQAARDIANAQLAASQLEVEDTEAQLTEAIDLVATIQTELAAEQAALTLALFGIAELNDLLELSEQEILRIEATLAISLNDASFTIPGETTTEKMANIASAIVAMNRGSQAQFEKALFGN